MLTFGREWHHQYKTGSSIALTRLSSWKWIRGHTVTAGGPISTKLGTMMQNSTPITVIWSKSQSEDEFQYGGRTFVFQKRKYRVVVLVLVLFLKDKFKVLVLILGAQVLVLVLVLDTRVLVLVLEEKSLVVSLFLVFFFVAFTKSFSAKPASKHTLHVRFYLLHIVRNCLW